MCVLTTDGAGWMFLEKSEKQVSLSRVRREGGEGREIEIMCRRNGEFL